MSPDNEDSSWPIAIGTRSTCNPYPIYNFLSHHCLSPYCCSFISSVSSITIPKIVKEALDHPGWQQVMIDEMQALECNGKWDFVPLPLGKKFVGCRWVYAIKVGPNDRVDHLEGRLVTNGYIQIYGLDHGDTYSFVTKMIIVRLFFAMVAIRH